MPGIWKKLTLKPESDELLHLDLMRFVASFGVLVLHSHLFLFPGPMRAAVVARTHNLGLFVDFFFVISGFVITYVYADRLHSPRDFGRFMQRRVGRLVPLHLLTLVAAMAVALGADLVGMSYNSMPSWNPRCVVGTIFLVQQIVPCGEATFNNVSWSISVEMALYLLFPLVLLVTRRSALIAGTITLTVIASLAVWGNSFERNWYFGYQPLRGIASFAFGMGLYHARVLLGRMAFGAIGLLVATPALIVAMTSGSPLPLCIALVYLVATFAVAADLRGKVHPLVRRIAPLGQLTYSLYMIHLTVLLVLVAGIGDKLLNLSTWPMLAVLIATYALIFLLALLSYRFFETPMRRWIDGLPIFPKGSNR